MGDLNTAPAEACAPDPDQADPDSPDLMPAWAAYLIALLILFLLEHSQSMRQRRLRRLASKPVARAALPKDSADASAAPIASQSDDMAARTRRSRAAAPECPELPRILQALLARLQQCDNGPSLWSQLEALGIVPGLHGQDAAAAPALLPPDIAKIRRAVRSWAPAAARQRVSPAPWRQVFTRAGTGPPTGPPAVSRHQSCYT